MTIVAGFCAADGLVLAGDTMYSGGAKIHQPKVFGYSVTLGENPCSLAFALAGHEDYGKMAIEDCVDEVRAGIAEERTIKSVKLALRTAIKQVNEEYVDRRPEAERESAKFELIIGVSVPPNGLRLFKTRGPTVVAAGDYHCAGSGWYLGDYLMRNTLIRSMSTREVILLAVQAFGAVKSYDANCGGETQFLMMLPSGEVTLPIAYDITRLEGHMAEFETLSRRLLLRLGDTTTTSLAAAVDPHDAGFEDELRDFIEQVRRIRLAWRQGEREYTRDFFRRLTAAIRGDPGPTTHDVLFPRPLQE